MTYENCYIFTSKRAMVTKRDRETNSDEKMFSSNSKNSVDYVDASGHMTNIKGQISISLRPVTTKLDRIVFCDKEPHSTKSHVFSIT